MLTLSRVGGSKIAQNAYGCLRCHGWVGPKTQMLTDAYVVVDGGSEIFRRVMMIIKPKAVTPISENWNKKTPKNHLSEYYFDLAGVRNYQKLGIYICRINLLCVSWLLLECACTELIMGAYDAAGTENFEVGAAYVCLR